ncbi:MAG: hypothetical protein AAB974_04625 [Patescibacteria group bacterium]
MKDTELRQKFVSMDEEFKKIDRRFEKIDERFVKADEKFDFLITYVIRLDEKVGRMLPIVEEFPAFKDYVITTLDHHTGMLERLDQERLSQHARSDRIEVRVDRLEKHTGLA